MALVVKSPRERFTELVGSLLGSLLVAVAMCVVLVLVNSFRATAHSPEQCAWLALMSIAGTWAVLIPSKFWEGTRGEAAMRRFIMMVIGLGLGTLGFGIASLLLVNLSAYPYYSELVPGFRPPSSFYDVQNGQPLAMAYMACFGTLFLLLRWWRQADPLRSSRLSLWSMLVSAVLAWLVAGVWSFPQPWLPMVAGAMSVSIQLASPWVSPRERLRRKEL